MHPISTSRLGALAAGCAMLVVAGCGGGGGGMAPGASHQIVRADRSASGTGGSAEATGIRLSANGRYAVFSSAAGDLVTGAGGVSHIFRKDLTTGAIILISRAWGAPGAPAANGSCGSAAISDDGTIVIFSTFANNLVAGDVSGKADIFAVDLTAGTIQRISVGIAAAEADKDSLDGCDVSGDGTTIVFASHATNLVNDDTNFVVTGESGLDMFVYRRAGVGSGVIKRISVDGTGAQKLGNSRLPRINQDGTVVAFQTSANLVGVDDSLFEDVYRVTLDWNNLAAPPAVAKASLGATVDNPNAFSGGASVNSAGRIVAFISAGTNLLSTPTNGEQNIFVYDRDTLTTTCISRGTVAGTFADGPCSYPSLSGDGRYVAFGSYATNLVIGDTNGTWDTFVHDRVTGRTTRASVGAAFEQNDGESYGACLSRDGSFVGFQGAGTKLPGSQVGVFHVFRALNTPSGSG